MENEDSTVTCLLHNGGSSSDVAAAATATTTTVLVLSSLVAVCGSLTYGSASGYSSPAESGIMNELGISLAEYSVFGSVLAIGGMVGAISSGKIADVLGRRVTMGISEIFCLIGWLFIVFAKGVWLLDLGRLLLGFGIGLISYVVPVYVAEIAPKRSRGVLTMFSQVMIAIGAGEMFVIGTVVNWRILALIGAIPCVIQILGLFFIPESPRWLEKNGKLKESEASLRHLRGANSDISQEAAEIRDYTETLQGLSGDHIFEVFRKYSRSLIVGVGLMALLQLGGISGVTYYASAIYEAAGFSSSVGTITTAVLQVPMSILGSLLSDTVGRRPLLMVSFAGMCLGCLIASLSFLLQDLNEWPTVAPVLVFIGLVAFTIFGNVIAGVPWLIMSEIFPINVKGVAGSLVVLVSWLGSWVVTYSFNFIFTWSSTGTFFFFASVFASGIVFVAMFVPETKDCTLEEIQASMNPFPTKR